MKDWKFTHKAIKTSIGNVAPLIYRTALMCSLGYDIDRGLPQRMVRVVTYHDEWHPDLNLIDDIALANQIYEHALLRFYSA